MAVRGLSFCAAPCPFTMWPLTIRPQRPLRDARICGNLRYEAPAPALTWLRCRLWQNHFTRAGPLSRGRSAATVLRSALSFAYTRSASEVLFAHLQTHFPRTSISGTSPGQTRRLLLVRRRCGFHLEFYVSSGSRARRARARPRSVSRRARGAGRRAARGRCRGARGWWRENRVR